MSSEDNSGSTATAAAAVAAAATGGAGGDAANRSIVVDAAFFEEQFLRCSVCQESFNETKRPPKSLPCNHTFCVPCLTQIFNHAQPQSRRNLLWADEALDGPLKCPTCRVEIFVSKNKIKDLPNDHRVVQMIDFLSQAVTTTKNVCTKHERQPLNFFCKKCLLPVCRDCTVLDHKEQQGHAIVDVKEALSDRSGEFNQLEELCRQTLERMKGRSDALANASKRLDILERQLRNEIKETFIEYRLLLEKRQEALTDSLRQRVRDQKALINTRFVHVCEHGTQLQKLFDAFSQAKESNNVEQLFNLHKQMKDHEEQFNSVAAAEDHELFKSCTFDSTSEGEFLSGISSLGEVETKDDLSLKEPVSAHQLLYLDNEDRRERERLMQYTVAGEQDLEDQDRDRDDAYDVHDDIGGHGVVLPRGHRERGEYFELQRMLDALGRHSSREENDQEDSGQHSRRPAHPMRRPRTQGSTTMSAVQLPPEIAAMMIGGDDGGSDRGSRSGSGSRSRRSRQGGSGSGSSGRGSGGFRDYRVERHTHFPTNEDSN
ncbi:E3 ubiquitin-protein ligase TRIM63-like isoform X2 [Littorina saxatilis]|uniref:Uncharacterized protein n=2 Tax=Littorina saxatilis TaxID=31220 RepID=A0AAN9B1A2_9CAEN